MSKAVVVADFALAGCHCVACDEPVQMGERVYVDQDSTGDDGTRVVTSVIHVVCPQKAAA